MVSSWAEAAEVGAALGLGSIGAVVLAGGASRRFGAANKLLAEVGGVPLLRRVVTEVADIGLGEVVVVTGFAEQACREVVAGFQVRFAHNAGWTDGMGGSIAAGVAALSSHLSGAFIVPGDMPGLKGEVMAQMMARFVAGGGSQIVVPVTAGGAQRNPVLWPKRCFPSLAALSGEIGGKTLLAGAEASRIDMPFSERVFFDVDTAEDLGRFEALPVASGSGA